MNLKREIAIYLSDKKNENDFIKCLNYLLINEYGYPLVRLTDGLYRVRHNDNVHIVIEFHKLHDYILDNCYNAFIDAIAINWNNVKNHVNLTSMFEYLEKNENDCNCFLKDLKNIL